MATVSTHVDKKKTNITNVLNVKQQKDTWLNVNTRNPPSWTQKLVSQYFVNKLIAAIREFQTVYGITR